MSPSHPSTSVYRASRLQQRMTEDLGTDSTLTSQCFVRFPNTLDIAKLNHRLIDATRGAAALHTALTRREGLRVAVQQPLEPRPPSFRQVSATGVSDSEIEEIAVEDAARITSIHDILHATCVLGEDETTLILTAPSVKADPQSLCEIAYRLAEGAPADELPYEQFSEWDHELPQDGGGESFRITVSGARFVAPAPVGDFDPAAIRVRAPDLAELEAAADRFGASVDALLLAAWCGVMAEASDSSVLTVAVLCSGRSEAELQSVIGLLARYVPVHLDGGASLAERVARADSALREADEWQHFRRLDTLASTASPGICGFDFIRPRKPVPDAAPAMAGAVMRATGWVDRLAVRLSCTMGATLDMRLVHDASQVDGAAAVLLGQRMTAALDEIVHPSRRAFLMAGDQAVHRSIAPVDPPSDLRPVHLRIAENADTWAAQNSVVDETETLTYAALEDRAGRLAGALAARGVGPGSVVAVLLPRSAVTIAAVYGVLKTGAAFAALDPQQASPRLRAMLDTICPEIVISSRDCAGALDASEIGQTVLFIDEIGDTDPLTSPPDISPDDLAYVVFTSGSTGVPKAVAVTHGNLAQYVSAFRDRVNLPPQARYGLVSGLDADIGYSIVFPALADGGEILLVSRETAG